MTTGEEERRALEALSRVKDPEMPVIDIRELGILRAVSLRDDGTVVVDITPTYSGCPAMETIEEEIRNELASDGFSKVEIRRVLSPPWTTDWISDEGKRKLKEFGIAPPAGSASDLVSIGGRDSAVECPYCGSKRTSSKSPFGPTSCKALYFCEGCHQPFEYLKPH